MNGLFKAWVTAALTLFLSLSVVRSPAATIQVIAENSPSPNSSIFKESNPNDPLLMKFKSEWNYLARLDSVPSRLTPPLPTTAAPNPVSAEPDYNVADPAAATNDSTINANSSPQPSANVTPAIVRAPGDGWQTFAAVAIVIAFTAIHRKTSAKAIR